MAAVLLVWWHREGRPPWRRPRDESGYLVAVVSAMVGTAWVARLHEGGYANVSMPAQAAVALVLGCLLGRALRSGRSTRRVVGDRFLVILSRLPGQVFVPTHPYYMPLDGLPPSPRPLRSYDIYRSRAGPELLFGTLPWNLDGVSTVILDNSPTWACSATR